MAECDVLIVSPVPATAATGNAVSARRIAGLLESRGWHTAVDTRLDGHDARALIALHARKCGAAVAEW